MSMMLLTLWFALLIQAPSGAQPAANARITGRVVDAASGAPVSGATVTLLPIERSFPPGATTPPQATTDPNGEFVLDRVWPGRFRVQIRKTGFAPIGDAESAPTLDVGAGQSTTSVTFTLAKGAVVAGRMIDTAGAPATDIIVHALRRSTPDSRGTDLGARTMQMAQTNDLGEFRLAGLPAGSYVLVATPPPQPPFAKEPPAGTRIPVPTFYPGTPDQQGAHTIDVAAGQTLSDIQFSIATLPPHHVSGVVVDDAGAPQAGALVTVLPVARAGATFVPPTAQSDATGVFTIFGVVDGTYRVMATMPMSWPVSGPVGAGGIGAVSAGGPGVPVTGGIVPATAGGIQVPTPVGGIAGVEVTVSGSDVSGLRVVVLSHGR